MEEGWSRVAAAAVGSAELCSELWLTSHQTAKTYRAKHQKAQREAESTAGLYLPEKKLLPILISFPENTSN